MGLWRETLWPRLCHKAMQAERHARYRSASLERARGAILEIGFGSGLNLPYYPQSVTSVVGIEPNPGLRKVAVRTMHEQHFPVTLLDMNAEKLSFHEGEFDCVVSTWTLCSIQNLDQALSEVRRVLKPGGEFIFFEHGLAPDPDLQKWQRRLSRVTKHIFDGCTVDKQIAERIQGAGLDIVSLDNFFIPNVPRSEGYIYAGAARKASTEKSL
ncbi:MAG: class I SAM-dependent methyltransferase [Calditrichaeota bacterium]|nr:class I SAM-dependent methyltransferase [Calditrichota bacterium]MCB9365756.1 class I SAM-dependent methyltransferase [Calditrichota bacterium]